MGQSLCKIVGSSSKCKTQSYKSIQAIPFLDMYPKKMKQCTKTHTWMLMAALIITAKKWKQLRSSSIDR